METLDVERYYNVITSQHRTKPKYMALLKAILKPLDDLSKCLGTYDYHFDVNFAVGKQLDIIGDIVGAHREVDFILEDGTTTLNDEDYRFYVKSKILQNHWNGTREHLFQIWDIMFPDTELNLIDNMDMSCDVKVKIDSLTKNQISMLYNGMLIPRPSGVKYNYNYELYDAIFAWDMESGNLHGYDIGKWEVPEEDHNIYFGYDSDTDTIKGWNIGSWKHRW